MSAAWWAMGGFGTGAGLMYLVDPRSGRRRRALAQDKAKHALHEVENAAGVVSRDMAHRSRGFFFETLARVKPQHVDEPTLEARVRAALGRVCSHPHAIRVHIAQGRVRLDGAILQAEHRRVLSRLQRVRGVRKVEDQLEVHKPAGHPPDLQGGVERPGDKPELLQRNWAPSVRFVMGLGGLGLLGWGSSRRGLLGTSATVFGAMLTLRSLTNLELKRLTGVGGGRQAIIIHKDITVHAPVEEVFAFWRAMENFPRFMRHIEEVRTHGEERSHWRVKGPAGIVFEWEATITRLIPNKVLAWKSIEGSTVQNSGIIHFEPAQEGRATRLDIRMSYNPPAGALGHAFARLMGADPKREMDDDLQR
ncbi:MAG TPA: SRPBCC family protein, partial [Myxococcaceae bacterium]|nr:SRPBCC family protein [Myxococcaceae bacterium]